MLIVMTNISKELSKYVIIWFLIFTSFDSNLVSSTTSQISYSDHCSSFVPETTQEEPPSSVYRRLSYVEHTSYYGTAQSSFKSLVFQLSRVYTTGVLALFSVEAKLVLESRYFRYNPSPANVVTTTTTTLWLRGFWSESSGKMCLVGGVRPYRRDDFYAFPVSLKLYNINDSSNLTSPVTGTLESLLSSDGGDLNYFSPIPFVLFTRSNYEYTLVSEEINNKSSFGGENELSPGLPLNSFSVGLAGKIFSRKLGLKYSGRCADASFVKKCSPFGDFVDLLPSAVQLRKIEISTDKQVRLRILIRFLTGANDSFWGYSALDPKTTLVGEGVWDKEKNRLFVVACRFLNATDSWAGARIGDCSTRLTLRFPAVWSMGNTSSVIGRIWSEKSEADPGYFDEIGFRSSESLLAGSVGMKYEYTKVEKAKKWCPADQIGESNRKAYPKAFSYDMRFDMFCRVAESNTSTGYAKPLTVGAQFYDTLWHRRHYSKWHPESAEAPEENVRHLRAFNVSYSIGFALRHKSSMSSSALVENWDVSAEGIYDTSTGILCMVGCRFLNDVASGCEILVRFQFPPKYSPRNAGFIRGTIESRRKKSDPLHFEPIDVSSAAYVLYEAQKSIRKADLEIIMSIISNTLSCLFTAAQLFHLRRNPKSLPFVSLAMLLALLFGHMTALLGDLKSLLVSSFGSQDVLLGSGGLVEARGVTRGITMLVLVLLQARLLQRVWFGRFTEESVDQNRQCLAEKEAVLVSLPLHFGAALLSVFFAWKAKNHDQIVLSSDFLGTISENPISVALKSYADIVSVGFLVPQVLLNVFVDSSEKSLSCSFYFGTTLVRVLLPHAYGLYKARSSGLESVSIAWDVMVPLASLLFAAVVYLQRKFGGRCILPLRFKESNAYEKVANVAEIET